MRPTVSVVALFAGLVVALISALHVFWALGGEWGGTGAVPSRPGEAPLFSPSVATTLVAAAIFALAAWIIVVAGGLARPVGPSRIYLVGTWCVGLAFVARAVGDFRYVGFFKRVHGTPFAAMDDRIFSPLALVIGLAVLWLAWKQVRAA